MSADRWSTASARAFCALIREPDLALGPDFDPATFASPWRALAERFAGWLDEDGSANGDAAKRLPAFLRAIPDAELGPGGRLGVASRPFVVERLQAAVKAAPMPEGFTVLAECRQAYDDARDAELDREESEESEERSALEPARLVRVDVGRMLREPAPPVPWIVDDVLARGYLTLLPGREGVGKSLFVMALVVGVVTGESTGPFATTPGRVMVVDAENGEGELHRRLRALGLAPGAEERLSIFTTEAGDLLNERDELAAAVAAEAPDLLVIDSFRATWRGKENASEEAGPAVDYVRNLARRADWAVALIHHAGKVGAEYRGSTAIGASVQAVVHVGRHADDPEPDRFVLTNPKLRMASRWPPKWIRLAVELGSIVCLEAAEPFTTDDLPRPPKAPAREKVGPAVARVLANGNAPSAPPRWRAEWAATQRTEPSAGCSSSWPNGAPRARSWAGAGGGGSLTTPIGRLPPLPPFRANRKPIAKPISRVATKLPPPSRRTSPVSNAGSGWRRVRREQPPPHSRAGRRRARRRAQDDQGRHRRRRAARTPGGPPPEDRPRGLRGVARDAALRPRRRRPCSRAATIPSSAGRGGLLAAGAGPLAWRRASRRVWFPASLAAYRRSR